MDSLQKFCSHCLTEPPSKGNTLCEACTQLPRCEVCEVFLDGMFKPSEKNPDRCDGCIGFEELIKFNCALCDNHIPLYATKNSKVLHFIVRGNICSKCNVDSRANTIGKKKEEDYEDKKQFVGYLGILENFYIAGSIDSDQWRYAIKMNSHDVKSWRGIEDIEKELGQDDYSN